MGGRRSTAVLPHKPHSAARPPSPIHTTYPRQVILPLVAQRARQALNGTPLLWRWPQHKARPLADRRRFAVGVAAARRRGLQRHRPVAARAVRLGIDGAAGGPHLLDLVHQNRVALGAEALKEEAKGGVRRRGVGAREPPRPSTCASPFHFLPHLLHTAQHSSSRSTRWSGAAARRWRPCFSSSASRNASLCGTRVMQGKERIVRHARPAALHGRLGLRTYLTSSRSTAEEASGVPRRPCARR